MTRIFTPVTALSALALATFSAPAAAEPVGAAEKAQAKVTLIYPLTVLKANDMDFGYLSSTTAGTAVLDPNTNTLSTTGGVTAMGGSPTAAEFTGAAQSSAVVNIKVPNQPITLTRVGGTETMTVDNWTLQGQSKRSIARMTSFTFRVGGTLNVNAAQAEGFYTGTFDITVQYP